MGLLKLYLAVTHMTTCPNLIFQIETKYNSEELHVNKLLV